MASTSISLPHLKPGYIFRAPTLDDVAGVVDVMNLNAIKVSGHADESFEGRTADWGAPGVNLETDQRIVLTPEGRIIGYAEVNDQNRPMSPFIDVYLHPDFWGDPLADDLMDWSEERARAALTNPKVPADARITLMAATYDTDTYYKGLLEKAGMSICRISWRMQIDFDTPPAPAEWPEGITIRVVTPDEDLRPILTAVREVWRDHWGYVESPFEENYARWINDWQGAGHFDPSLWYLAMDGDQITGFALCKPRFADDDDLGWVQTLGVQRPYRKHGQGMALLQHAFHQLYHRGKPRVGLGVDAGSLTGATRLYQRAGMRVVMQFEVYEKELRPGVDYRTQEVDE